MSIVRAYLEAVAAQDWDQAARCLAEDVRRIGPFGDVYQGRREYLEYLRALMPTLAGYRMDLRRLIETDHTVVAELTETVAMPERSVETAESLIFDLDSSGRIAQVAIYIQSTGT